MIDSQDIALLEKYGTLGIVTTPLRDLRILDGSYEDARKEFYANIDFNPKWIYSLNSSLLAGGSVGKDDIVELIDAVFCVARAWRRE